MSPRAPVFGVVALVAAQLAAGHAASTSYLTLHAPAGKRSTISWDVSVAELHRRLGLDVDGDRLVTWREIEAQRTRIWQAVQEHLSVHRGRTACSLSLLDLRLARRAGEMHLSFEIALGCVAEGRYRLASTLFFDENTLQRTLVDARTSGGAFSSVLSPDASSWVEPDRPRGWLVFAQFIWQGMLHVWAGYDHIAFIVLLLLPSVLQSRAGRWRTRDDATQIVRPLVLIVTSFTVAHSTTLALAATGRVSLPAGPVEAAIAVSIIVAALINLFPRAEPLRLPAAFVFGLVHGLGFANVFAQLGRGGAGLLPVLGGFNVGVELAQLSIVLAALPVLMALRRTSYYATRLMPAASLAIAAVGALWLAQRIA